MKRAGLSFRKSKLKICSQKNETKTDEPGKNHEAILLKSIDDRELIIFIDETYVNNQIVINKLWVKNDDSRIICKPSWDKRITIIAAS